MFITIDGTIGVGKTTMAKALSKHYSAPLYKETFDSDLLEELYKGNHRKALTLEVMFLSDRRRQLKEIESDDSRIVVSDYNLRKSLLFVSQTLTNFEQTAFKQMYDDITDMVIKPTITIILVDSTENLKKNIRKRNRDFEENISDEYLDSLNKMYEKLYLQLLAEGEAVIYLDASKVEYSEDLEEIVNMYEIAKMIATAVQDADKVKDKIKKKIDCGG